MFGSFVTRENLAPNLGEPPKSDDFDEGNEFQYPFADCNDPSEIDLSTFPEYPLEEKPQFVRRKSIDARPNIKVELGNATVAHNEAPEEEEESDSEVSSQVTSDWEHGTFSDPFSELQFTDERIQYEEENKEKLEESREGLQGILVSRGDLEAAVLPPFPVLKEPSKVLVALTEKPLSPREVRNVGDHIKKRLPESSEFEHKCMNAAEEYIQEPGRLKEFMEDPKFQEIFERDFGADDNDEPGEVPQIEGAARPKTVPTWSEWFGGCWSNITAAFRPSHGQNTQQEGQPPMSFVQRSAKKAAKKMFFYVTLIAIGIVIQRYLDKVKKPTK